MSTGHRFSRSLRTQALYTLLLLVAGSLALVALLSFHFGRPGLRVESPENGQVVGIEGVEVLVRFAVPDQVEASTFRVLLNGADVTEEFETAANGAHGRLHGLLDGENQLSLEVFRLGPRPWARWLEDRIERTVQYRPPLRANQG